MGSGRHDTRELQPRDLVLETYSNEERNRRSWGKAWAVVYFSFQVLAITAGAIATVVAAINLQPIYAAAAAAAATLSSTVLAVLKPRDNWKRQAHASHRLLVERLRLLNTFTPYDSAHRNGAPTAPPSPPDPPAEPDVPPEPAAAISLDPFEVYLDRCEAIIQAAWAQEEEAGPPPTANPTPGGDDPD